ncbi:MAG: TIR domain-containing protein [Anaerolineae bacterium]|nr:TIR domain-containing protein [Anaerolineae bacterium]
MPRIFISYRRVDSGAYAGRIYDRLKDAFGAENVFKDSYNIKPGMDFRGAIREQVGRCDVLLALIGPWWLDVALDDGTRRLDVPDDWLRLEIETGLQRDSAVVIPVLIGGASIPDPAALPPSIRELAFKNGVMLRDDPFFDRDIEDLIEHLQAMDGDAAPAPPAAPAGNTQSGSGNVQQNIGSVSNSTVTGRNGPPEEPKGCLAMFLSSPRWQGIGAIATILALIVAIIALPQLQGDGQSATETPTTVPTTVVPATDTAEPATDAPTPTLTEASTQTPTDAPLSAPTEAPTDSSTNLSTAPTTVAVGGVTLKIFRDEDSFTLYAPEGSDLSGLEYRVTTNSGEETYALEAYAGFRGLPFADLPQEACFRLVRSGGTHPTPLQCTSGALLLSQQLASADRFWRDMVAGVDRTVLVYQNDALVGTCPAGEDACEIDL